MITLRVYPATRACSVETWYILLSMARPLSPEAIPALDLRNMSCAFAPSAAGDWRLATGGWRLFRQRVAELLGFIEN